MIKSQFSIRSRAGSILIWSVMLGFLLTSVFFFFSVRQRATITIQQDTAEILNARQYLESYADYIQNLPEADLETLRSNPIEYDGITGSVTNSVKEITGVADVDVNNEPILTSYAFDEEIFIEWNKCSENLKGSIILNDVLYEHDNSDECALTGQGYDDLIGPIKVTNPKIKTFTAPFYYHITPKDSSAKLTDNKWQLDIKIELDYGKMIEVKRVF